jgi:hypothetical protein
MLDAGLRISEVQHKCKNFDFKIETSQSNQQKKKRAKHLRTIPISNRLYQAIGEYLKRMKFQ